MEMCVSGFKVNNMPKLNISHGSLESEAMSIISILFWKYLYFIDVQTEPDPVLFKTITSTHQNKKQTNTKRLLNFFLSCDTYTKKIINRKSTDF